MEISRTYEFSAAHSLPKVPEGHKCRNVHGHTFVVEVRVGGALDPRMGWVVDLAEVDRAVRPLIKQLDHTLLNETPGLENPTSEMLSIWLWRRLKKEIPLLRAVVVHESPRSSTTYRGEWISF